MSDLLIGTRRPRSQNTVRAIAILGLLAVIAGAVSYLIFRRLTTYDEPGGSLPKGRVVATPDGTLAYAESSLEVVGSLRVLRLRGKPHAIGAARGRLTGDEAAAVGATFDDAIARSVPRASWLDRRLHGSRVRWRYRFLDEGVPPQQLSEIAGLMRGIERTRGSGPAFDTSLRRTAAIDVGRAARGADRSTRAVARSFTFVTPVRDERGDRLMIGRSFGLLGARDAGDAAAESVTVAFVHADGAIPYASVEWAGAIGVVSGLNREGIAVMVNPSLAADVKPARPGQPIALLARDVLENATSLDDAIGILEAAEPLGAASFVVVDGGARKWAVVERSPERTVVHRKPPSAVIADVLVGEAFVDDPINDRARRVRPSTLRAERAAELLRATPPRSPEDVAAVLRDRRGVGGTALPLGHRGAVDDLGAAHVAVFDASRLVVWVAEGGAASGRMRAFNLRHELGGEPFAPAADIPVEASFDHSRAGAVRTARRYVRRAQRAWRADNRGRARELVERALAHAPDLPAAQRLAGDLARARGDRATAKTHYRTYLQNGPDDLGAAEEIRAVVDRP